MNKIGEHPWALTFSYGRALQATAISSWQGKDENRAAGQDAFLLRAKCNSAASLGNYDIAMESA